MTLKWITKAQIDVTILKLSTTSENILKKGGPRSVKARRWRARRRTTRKERGPKMTNSRSSSGAKAIKWSNRPNKIGQSTWKPINFLHNPAAYFLQLYGWVAWAVALVAKLLVLCSGSTLFVDPEEAAGSGQREGPTVSRRTPPRR